MYLSPLVATLAIRQILAATSHCPVHQQALYEALDALTVIREIRDLLGVANDRNWARSRTEELRMEGAPWSQEEDELLVTSYEEGLALDEIAVMHERAPLEVAARLQTPLNRLTNQDLLLVEKARSQDLVCAASSAGPPVTQNLASCEEAPLAKKAGPDAVLQPEVLKEVTCIESYQVPPASFGTGLVEELPSELSIGKSSAKPAMTEAEEQLVNLVLTRYTAKNAPRTTLRLYIESEKFKAKVSSPVCDWLQKTLVGSL